VPALLVAIWYGASGMASLLVLSQVILSLQLPFAIVPLIRYTSSKKQMGCFANPRWMTLLAAAVAALIVALNLTMLLRMAREFLS
jgi:manganese transport protein